MEIGKIEDKEEKCICAHPCINTETNLPEAFSRKLLEQYKTLQLLSQAS